MLEKTDTKLSSFIKGSTVLVLSNICLKAINFFLLPLYTDNLTPEMMGISDSITTLTGIIFPILTLGLDSAYSAFYFDKGDDERSKKVFHTLTLSFILIGFIPILLMLFSTPISSALFHKNDYSYIVNYAFASVSFNLWFLPYSLELRLKNRMFLFSLANVIASLSMVLLNILFVSVMHLGEASLVLSTTIVHAEQILIYILFVRVVPSKKYFDFALLKKMLKFSIPLIPMSIMMWVLSLSDRYVLLYTHGSDSVGIYGIGLRFTTLLNVVISAVTIAYTTFAFSSKDDSNAKKMYFNIYNIMAFLLMGASFTVGLFGKEIIQFMTAESYSIAYLPLRDLMFAQSIYGITTIVGYGISFKKKSIYHFLAVTAGAVLNLLLNLLLIPQYGIVAASLTTLLGYLLYYILTLYYSKKLYPCNYGEVKVGITMVALYFICFVSGEMAVVYKMLIWSVCAIITIIAFKKQLSIVIKYLSRKIRTKKETL